VRVVDISVLITTYNRSELLLPTLKNLESILELLPYSSEVVIADDCSNSAHREVIDSIPSVRVVRTEQRSGLGANTNNGLSHCAGRLVLQVQDDWKCQADHSFLNDVYEFIGLSSDVGVVQLTAVGTDLPVEHRFFGETSFRVCRNDHLPWMRHCSVRPYSDQPHLKRREFIESVGPYLERVPMAVSENDYKRRVANQSRWKVALLEGPSRFVHTGAEVSLNPGGQRHLAVEALRRLPGAKAYVEPSLRNLVRRVDHFAATLLSR
jgi:glycosyltransferase involved in cell wall biosynthesis